MGVSFYESSTPYSTELPPQEPADAGTATSPSSFYGASTPYAATVDAVPTLIAELTDLVAQGETIEASVAAAATAAADAAPFVKYSAAQSLSAAQREQARDNAGHVKTINVADYVTFGSADNTTSLALAITRAVALNAELVFPPWEVFAVATFPAGLNASGTKGVSKITRPATSTSNFVVWAQGNNKLRGLIIDGNKAANLNPCNGLVLYLGGSYDIEDCEGNNTKAVSGGYGSGIILSNTTDIANGTRSRLVRVTGRNDDTNGVDAIRSGAFDMIDAYGVSCGGVGVSVSNFTIPIEVASLAYIYVRNARGESCTGGGVSIAATLLDTSGDDDISSSTVYDTIVEGAYGKGGVNAVSIQGQRILATNLHGDDATTTGILANVANSILRGLSAKGNGVFGLDCGGSLYSDISGLHIADNTNNGVNCGGGVNLRVGGGFIGRNGQNLFADKYENDGTFAFALPGSNLTLHDLVVDCTGGGSGVFVSGGLTGRAENVNVKGATRGFDFIILSDDFRLYNCSSDADDQEGMEIVAAATTTIISETADQMFAFGTTSIQNLLTQNQSDYVGAVAFLTLDTTGSGFTGNGTLDFSGGSGSGASGLILRTKATGHAGSPRMSTKGAGYTANFTVPVTGGGGSGASCTAHVGLAQRMSGRRITLVFQDATTLLVGGNINTITGANYSVDAFSVISFVNVNGVWNQESYGLRATLNSPTFTTPTVNGSATFNGQILAMDHVSLAATKGVLIAGTSRLGGDASFTVLYDSANRQALFIGGPSGQTYHDNDQLILRNAGTTTQLTFDWTAHNVYPEANLTVALGKTGHGFLIDGSINSISNVPATSLTGTIASARLSGSYTGITGTGALTAGSTGAGFTVAFGTATLTGTVPSANISGSYTGITGVGTLTAGATGVGFTVALSTATITGTLAAARLPQFTGGDVTTSGAGSVSLAIGATKVTNAMLNADVFSNAHTWSATQTFSQATVPLIVGGSGVSQVLELRSTSGVGGGGDGVTFTGGTNGGTPIAKFLSGYISLFDQDTSSGGLVHILSVNNALNGTYSASSWNGTGQKVTLSVWAPTNNGGGSPAIPFPALTLARQGVGGAAYNNFVDFRIGREVNDGFLSRTILEIGLSDGAGPEAKPPTALRITSKGSVICGLDAATATSATDGFLYLPTCAGTPTGTPTAKTGKAPFIYDSTNNKLYAYNSAWKQVTMT